MKPVSKSARRRLSTQSPDASTNTNQDTLTAATPAALPNPRANCPHTPAPNTALAALILTATKASALPPAASELDNVPAATTSTKGNRIPGPDYFEPVRDSPPSGGHHTAPLLDDPSEESVCLLEVPSESWDASREKT